MYSYKESKSFQCLLLRKWAISAYYRTMSDETKNDSGQAYMVLARKYRPANFEELIGQEAMVQTLRNAFSSGRIAQAYMLTGVRGVGKTTTARILARALNYTGGGATAPTIAMTEMGEHCQAIMESRHVDILEMDAASHTGIDDIREIIESVKYAPVSARYKVYIIDEVHMLSKAAFNGLLKTLEEPPAHVKFIFATTEIQKVPVTVLSRCQRFDLRRIEASELVTHFRTIAEKEGADLNDEALAIVARGAEGSVRDGLSILDQLIARSRMGDDGQLGADDVRDMLGLADRSRVFTLLGAVLKGETAQALELLDSLFHDGADPLRLLGELSDAVHLVTRAKVTGQLTDVTLSEGERIAATDLSKQLGFPALSRAWQMLVRGIEDAGIAPDQHIAADMVIIRMAYIADMPSPEEVIKGMKNAPVLGVASQNNSGSAIPSGGVINAGEGKVTMSGQGGGAVMQQTAQAVGDNVVAIPMAVEAAQKELPNPQSFEELVELCGDQREIMLKMVLEEAVRLVKFSPGHLEIQLMPEAPRGLANDLGRKLHSWTGERWLVSVAMEGGGQTLDELRQEKQAIAHKEVLKNDTVKAIMKAFPGAKIEKIMPLGALKKGD